jgi:dTDP-4-dehydrorhamnose reductase
VVSRGAPVVIFGGAGQVGQALLRRRGSRSAVALGRAQADLTDEGSVDAALDEHRPAAAINAAVFQPVDLCEREVGRAFAVNAAAAGLLAARCAARSIRLVHLSTDYVFDGAQQSPYGEEDCPRPLGVYAASKLAGEHLVLAADPRHTVVRTSSVYGQQPGGGGTAPFVVRMLERARAGEPTRVVDDQIVSPTFADDLAAAIWQLLETDAAGIVHLAGSSPASWYQVAEQVFAAAGRPDLLEPTSSAEYGAPAPRPAYSALRSVRLEALGIAPLPGVEDGLARFFGRLR